MRNKSVRISLFILVTCLLSFQSPVAQVDDTDFLFLQISTVAGANGMGNAGLTLVNPSAPLYNPGAIGLYHLDHNFGQAVQENIAWLVPVTDDLWVRSRSMSVGFNLKQLMPSLELPVEVSLGFGKSKKQIDYGPISITDELGNPLGTFGANEKADIYSYSIGLKRGLEIGIGYSRIKIKSHLYGSGASTEYVELNYEVDASDFGLIARLPLGEIFSEQLSFKLPILGRLQPIMTPSIAKVTTKIDQLPAFADSPSEVKIKKSSWSVMLGLKTGRASLISANFVEETVDPSSQELDIKKNGFELGLAGTYFIRSGSYDDPAGHLTYDSKGWGFSLRGLLDLSLEAKLFGKPKGIFKYILEHIDLRVDHAEYPDDPGLSLANTEFTTWSISL